MAGYYNKLYDEYRKLAKENKRLREENKQLKIVFQNTTTVLLHDMPRNNCIGCQLAILEGEELCSRMERLILEGGGSDGMFVL